MGSMFSEALEEAEQSITDDDIKSRRPTAPALRE